MLFTVGVCLVAALIFGLAPALSSLRIRIVDTLKEGGAKGSGGIRKRRLQTFLVGFQITIAVVLLTSAFFMIQSIRSMQTSDFGFELDSVQTLQISLPQNRYEDAAQRRNYFDQAVREVRAIAGVEAAAAILPLPLNQTTLTMDFRVDGQPLAPGERLFANQMSITPGFFETMKVPLRRGRVFSDADNDTGEPVIVINETMANRFWQGGDAVGRRVWLIQRGEEKAVTVVGVVADIRHRVEWQEGDEIWPQIYRPWGQAPRSLAHLVVRGRNVDALLPAVRRTIYSIDAAVPIETPRSMREVAQESFQPIQIVSSVLGLLAIVAMTLAAVGIYGIVAYTLSRRLREIGIRMALGSSPSMIIRLILKQGLIYAVFGGMIGMLVAFAALTALKSALAGLADLSPILFVGVALFVAVVALIANFFPARRAAGLSPVFMLRQE